MAITLGVGPTNAQCVPGTTFNISLSGTTIGRGIVISVCWQDNGGVRTLSSVQVSGESDATIVAGSLITVDLDHVQHAYLPNNTGGGSKTITVNLSGSAYAVGVAVEVAGQNSAAAAEASLNAGAMDYAAISGNITTLTANAAIFAAVTAANSATAGTNFTLLSNPRPQLGYQDEDEYWLDAGSAGSKIVSFAVSPDTGGRWLLSAIAISAGGGGTTPRTFTGTDSLAGGELL